MKNAKKRSILAPLSAGFCATVLAVAGGLSSNVSYASVASATRSVHTSSVNSSEVSGNSNYVQFTNPKLKDAILNYLKDGSNASSWGAERGKALLGKNDTGVTLEQASKVTNLNLCGKGISSIEGIENFTNLNRIDFDHNSISDLSPLASITSLESIYATYNKISDLTPLQSLSSLKCLRASSNKITDFSTIGNLTSLETLYLGENPGIKNFDTLKKFTNLTDLNLDSTQFSDLNIIKDLTKLKLLYLQSTDIADLSPIEGLTNLETLSLYDNKFTSLEPLKNLTKLKSISLGLENGIKSISVLEELPQLNSLSMYGLKFSLSSEQQSTPLGIEYADKLSFSSSVGSVEKGSFVLNDSINLPYKDDVTIEFKNDKSFKIGNVTIGANGYNGKIKLHLNVPKIETVEGKMTYEGDASIDYNTQKKISDPVKGKKKRYKNGHEDTIVDAKNGLTKVGNKEVVTEEIQPGTIYQADSSLAYRETNKTVGTKGTRTIEKFHSVDPNTGAISTAFSSNSGITKKAIDTVIKVGNVDTKTETIKFKTIYIADDTLAYEAKEDKTAGKNGSKTVTTTYRVDKTTGLTKDVESTKEKTVDPTDHVVRVGNKQVTHEGNKTITTTYDVDKDTGKLTNPKKHTSMPAGTLTPAVQHDNSEPAVLDTQEAEVLLGKMKYEADDTLPYNTQKKISDPVDGLKITTHTGSFVNGKWGPSDKVETTAAQDGLTKVGNKQVTHEGNKTITTTYDVDPDTGKLTNPKKRTSMPMASLIDPSANPDPGPNPDPDSNDNGGGDNNDGGSVEPESTDIPELNIGGGNGGNGDNTNGSGVGENANNGGNRSDANNGTVNGAAVNNNSGANRSGSAKSQATRTRSADALPNTGSNAYGAAFASFGAMVFGMFAAGAAANRKRAKHLR
ncbi:leucine-rich repeat domain-containing protein [Gardnerella vaginalis]|uniref:LPXTG-motif protein cell wall anchor domain protein n=1 Tax=Gardnerella vaginalis TaxID=2702 RepID=A0A133NQ40_GARVA|nr:leucine-rich repeat domain-containing protein [Gardnerella vaginalis]KXA18414.1 LPXTG-motif protein cell wall anchor domain protein [Gardnerella vaginalis]